MPAPTELELTRLYQVLAASQKGLGVPPGLCVACASQKAISVFKARKAPPTSYFASWSKWLPVMEAYAKGAAAYFATPSVVCSTSSASKGNSLTTPQQLIYALQVSLTTMTTKSPSLEERFKLHREASAHVKNTIQDMGLSLVSHSDTTSLAWILSHSGGHPILRCRSQRHDCSLLPRRPAAFRYRAQDA